MFARTRAMAGAAARSDARPAKKRTVLNRGFRAIPVEKFAT